MNPKSFFQPPAWLVTKGFQGTGWLLVNATQGIGLNWKPAVITWWGFMAYGDPFISGVPQAEDDLGLPVLKGGLCEYELDWAIQEVHDEIREKGISLEEQVIIKKLDREIWLRGRRANKRSNLNCAGRAEQKNDASHFDEAKWELIFNPLLKEIGLVYMDQESTYEVDRNRILSAPRSEPLSSSRNLIANQKKAVRREIPGNHPFPAVGIYEPASKIAINEDLLCDTLGIDCHENHVPEMTRYSLADHMEATLNTYVFEKDGEHYLIFVPHGLEKGLEKFIS